MGKHKKEERMKHSGFIVYAAVAIVIFFIISTGVSYIMLINTIKSTILNHVVTGLIIMTVSSFIAIRFTAHNHQLPDDIRKFSALSAGAITIVFLGIILRDILVFPYEQAAILGHKLALLGHTVNLLLPLGYGVIVYLTAIFTVFKVK